MYEYLIDGKLVSFNSELDAANALVEAETNGVSWELVSEPDTDGDATVKTEEETKKEDAQAIVPKGFQTGPAADVDAVPEIATSEDTESNLDTGSLVLENQPLKGEELNVIEGSEELNFNTTPKNTRDLDELLASPFPEITEKEANDMEGMLNSIPEIKQKRFESGRAKVVTKDFLERGIYQLDDQLSGESLTEKDDNGELTKLAIENVKDYFDRQPEGTLLDSNQMEAIVFNQINDLKKKESVTINNEDVAVFTEMQEQGNSEAFEKATVSTEWNTYSKNKKGLVIANQELAKAVASDDGSEEKSIYIPK